VRIFLLLAHLNYCKQETSFSTYLPNYQYPIVDFVKITLTPIR
jgi:hypothetical protein